jgi:monofunctional biosynthetic peptidoglycan transglycosylase
MGQEVISLFDLSAKDAAARWQIVNDDVMGGVSTSRAKVTEDHHLMFSGVLSLANNGGFASVRSRPSSLGLTPGDALRIRLRGDGRDYTLNLYLRQRRTAFSYRAEIQTNRDEWLELTLPLKEFRATSFGSPVRNAGPVNPASVDGIGFMISDKKSGRFQLEIESIEIVRNPER